jgi:predicted HNH restriction endonuclease
LEFHHKNPDEKDFSFRESRGFTDEEIANELKKCELLCANCHREVHEEMGW